MKSLLQITAHRPWPLPRRPWIMAQSWHDLLFAHWPLPVAQLRALIPPQLAIDTFDREAWIAVVPFRMSGVRLRWTPPMPWLSGFPELNVRTYVVRDGKPGVWFFSLDAGNPIAVAVARAWFHLPYFRASMRCRTENASIEYQSNRTHSAAPPAALRCRYQGTGEIFHPQPGTLEHFLTERYCLYTSASQGKLVCGEIHHPPWLLQRAEAEITENTMTQAAGLGVPAGKPLLHFAKRQGMLAWPPRVLDR
jgi:uncharacterized protein YqjF (DUF2071 family)